MLYTIKDNEIIATSAWRISKSTYNDGFICWFYSDSKEDLLKLKKYGIKYTVYKINSGITSDAANNNATLCESYGGLNLDKVRESEKRVNIEKLLNIHKSCKNRSEDCCAIKVNLMFNALPKSINIPFNEYTLKHLTKKDSVKYFQLYTDDELNKYWGYDYKDDIPSSTTDSFYNMQKNDYNNGDNVCLAIKFGELLIGEVIAYNFGCDKTVEFGCRIFCEYSGKRIGTQALSTIIDYFINKFNVKAVTKCYKCNIPSVKMMAGAKMINMGADDNFYYFERKNK